MGERVLFVGERNPYGSDDYFALYPEPAGAAGARLCEILGLSHREYLRRFDRINLLKRDWSLPAARRAAVRLAHRRRILLGARVCAAHGVPFDPFNHFSIGMDVWVLVLPHPSGRCRLWNGKGAVEKARAAVLAFTERPFTERPAARLVGVADARPRDDHDRAARVREREHRPS